MKHQNELELMAYKITEIKEDLKGITIIEERLSRLEKLMYIAIGAITLITAAVPIAILIVHIVEGE